MSMNEYEQEYNKHFQIVLLAHLVKDEELFKDGAALELTDFELEPCQVVFEAARDFHRKMGRLPNQEELVLHSRKVALNAGGEFQSNVKDEERQALEQLMHQVGETIPASADYFRSELPKFIKGVRISRIMDRSRNDVVSGSAADAVLSEIKKVEEDVNGKFQHETVEFITPAQDAGLVYEKDWVPPISTGLTHLDRILGGGVQRKEIGLISAPSGIGKTNLLIFFLVMAAYQRLHSLFFSLELPGGAIRGRAAAMISGIDAQNLRRPVETWDRRTEYLMSLALYKNPVTQRFSVMDSSMMKPTLDSLERNIDLWKKRKIAEGVKEEQLAEVAVDWVDYVNVPFASKMEEWQRYIIVAQQLGFIARRTGTHIWIANQTTKQAEAKAVMRMGDTARGYHLNDAMDVSIGVNLTEEYRITEENDGAGAGGKRGLKFSIAKNRHGDLGTVEAMRGPSLRMFDDLASLNAFTIKTHQALNPDTFDQALIDQYAEALVRIQTEAGSKYER